MEGCAAVDRRQLLLPHWRRKVTACLTTADMDANAAAGGRELPDQWTIRRQEGYEEWPGDDASSSSLSSLGSSSSSSSSSSSGGGGGGVGRLFPICAAHERERREWRAAHGTAARISGPLVHLVDEFDRQQEGGWPASMAATTGLKKKNKKKSGSSDDGSESNPNLSPADTFKQTLQAFYTALAPEKLKDLDLILSKFEGKHDRLVQQLEKKYNKKVADYAPVVSKKRKAPGGTLSAPSPAKKAPKKMSLKELLAKKNRKR